MRHKYFYPCISGNAVRDSVVADVIASPSFAVLIDETTDITVMQQLILYIKYLKRKEDGKFCLQTDFLGIIQVRYGYG